MRIQTTRFWDNELFSDDILLELFVGKREENLLERRLAERVVLDAGGKSSLSQLHATEHRRPAHLRIVRHVVGEQTVLFGSDKRDVIRIHGFMSFKLQNIS